MREKGEHRQHCSIKRPTHISRRETNRAREKKRQHTATNGSYEKNEHPHLLQGLRLVHESAVTEDGFALGAWVIAQRKEQKKVDRNRFGEWPHFSHMSHTVFAISRNLICPKKEEKLKKNPTPVFPICGDPISPIGRFNPEMWQKRGPTCMGHMGPFCKCVLLCSAGDARQGARAEAEQGGACVGQVGRGLRALCRLPEGEGKPTHTPVSPICRTPLPPYVRH